MLKKRLILILIVLWAACAQAGPSLRFLDRADSNHVWVLDSSFDPAPVVGVLDPPYDVGLNRLSRIDLKTGQIDAGIPLGDDGPVLAFDLGPNGDQALALRIGSPALLVIDGLKTPEEAVVRDLPLPYPPLSIAISPDGRRAAIGYQTDGGEAKVSLVDGLASGAPRVHPPVGLAVQAAVLAAVEAVAFTPDGTRVVTQTALHEERLPSPRFFTPDIALQSHRIEGATLVPSAAFHPDSESVIPPAPPFSGLPTGAALGDFAISCDGERLIVPVSGALDLGQPDARILLVEGVATGLLTLTRTLSLEDGVDLAPFQVELGAGCDRAIVTNAFAGTVSELTGIRDGVIHIQSAPTLMPFPAEPAVTGDRSTLIVHHPRPPLDGVPASNVTLYDLATLQPRLEPVFGEVRAWLQAKDRTLAAWPAGLSDRVAAFGWPRWAERVLVRNLKRAVAHAEAGRYAASRRRLRVALRIGRALERVGIAERDELAVIETALEQARDVLP